MSALSCEVTRTPSANRSSSPARWSRSTRALVSLLGYGILPLARLGPNRLGQLVPTSLQLVVRHRLGCLSQTICGARCRHIKNDSTISVAYLPQLADSDRQL